MRKLKPEEMARLSYIVGDMYAEADSVLIHLIIQRLIDGTPKLPFNIEQWKIEKILQAAPLKREMIAELKRILGDVPKAVDRVLYANLKAINDDEDILEYIEDKDHALRLGTDIYISGVPKSVRFIYEKYKEVALHELNLVNTSMLVSGQQQYIDILNVAAGLMHSEQVSPYIAIKTATRKLVKDGLTGFYDRAGRRWEPQSAVEMIMRTNGNHVANQALFTRMDETGVNFITISAHLGARPKCFQDQGQIFSRNGGSGYVEDANGNKIPYRDWNESSYGEPDGILGINCRHSAGFFVPGKSTFNPVKYDESVNAERYKQEQKQRRYERELRKTKRARNIARELGDEDETRRLNQKARLQSQRLREHIAEHDLRRSKIRERPMDKPVKNDLSLYEKSVGNSVNKQKDTQVFYDNDGNSYNTDEELLNAIRTEFNLEIHEGRQGKHIKGHNNYEGGGYLYDHIDPQELVNQYAGTGEIRKSLSGNWYNKQMFTHTEPVGQAKVGNEYEETDYFSISYSKEKGTHVVPRIKRRKK